MAKKDKRQRQLRAQKRKERREASKRKRRKDILRAKATAGDSLLASEASLHGCYVTSRWQEAKMADVVVARSLPDGLHVGIYLIDLAWLGLKDAFVRVVDDSAEFSAVLQRVGNNVGGMERIGLSRARELVYAGIAWAEKWGYPLPDRYERTLKLLGPRPEGFEPDLSGFGENGKPMIIARLDELSEEDLGDLDGDDDESSAGDVLDMEDDTGAWAVYESAEDVLRSVRLYYGSATDWEPDVKQEWIEEFLMHAVNQGADVMQLSDLWGDLFAFVVYHARTEYRDLAGLPAEEYGNSFLWASQNVLAETRYDLNLSNARRFLGHIRDFYRFLVERGWMDNCTELETAYDRICGGDRLDLLDPTPSTGEDR